MSSFVEVRELAVHYHVRNRAPLGLRLPRDLPDLARVMYGALIPRREAVLKAVDGVSLAIDERETLGLVGESGCGKSTLGRAIVRLERPRRGSITVESLDVHRARGRAKKRVRRLVQMVFQDPYASLSPRMAVGDIVAEPMLALGVEHSASARRDRVADLLARCGLDATLARRYPHELSGGQRQRVAIARALAPEPRLIVADEPVSALDVSIQAQLLGLLTSLREERALTMLFIAHDLAVVRHIAQRIAVMYLGRVVEVGPAADVVESPLHPYTKALIAAVPSPDPRIAKRRELRVLTGEAPSPLAPPPGCAFSTRCPEVTARCRAEAPCLTQGALARPVACHVAHGET